MMKLKQFMLALVAMLLGFAMSSSAQTSVVSTLDELKAALGNSTDIVVVGDITVDETVVVSEGTTVSVGTMVYVVSTENPYPGVTYNKTATKSGKISGNTFSVGFQISLDGGETWFTDTTNGKAQAVTVKTDGTKSISTSFQSAFTSAKCGEVVHMLKDAHVQSTNSKKNNGPLRSYYGLILEGNGHTIYTDLESSGASNEYATIKFTSYLAGTGADVRPVLKNVTIDSQKNAKADLDIVSGDVTFTVSLYNVNLLNKTANATLSFLPGTSMVINKSIVKLFDASIPAWDAGSANAIEFYSGDYSLSFNGKCKVYGGTFSKNPSSYLADCAQVKQESGKYVVSYKAAEVKVEVTPSEEFTSSATEEEKAVADELASNTAVSNETLTLPVGVSNFTVQLTDIETTAEAATKVTFNVEPKDASGAKVSNPSEAITFRLPVPAAWSGKANVYHEGTLLGAYTIKEESGAKYVEVSSSSFSEFSVEAIVPTEVEVATLAELQAALADNSNELPIIITAQIEIPAGETVTIDLNGKIVTVVYQAGSTTKHIYSLDNYGTLTIKDTKGNGSINSRGIFVQVGSKLTVESGSIYGIDSNGGSALYQYGGDIVINGGHIEQKAEGTYNFAINALGGTVTVNGGKIAGNHGAIAAGGATVVINDGELVCTGTAGMTDNVLYTYDNGTITINGGTFVADKDGSAGGCCVYDANGGATINGGTFKGSSGGDVWGTTGTTIKGGKFENLTEKQHIAEGYELNDDGTVVEAVKEIKVATLAELQAALADNSNELPIIITETIVIPEGETVVLDLNGKTVTRQDETTKYAINNLGTLTIQDTKGNGSINARGIYNGYGNGGANVATAKITVLSGTINAKGTNGGGAAIFNYGVADIQGGTFTSVASYAIALQTGSIMTIGENAIITGGINSWQSTLTITGGTISNDKSGKHVVYAGESAVTINGGTFHNNNSGNATIMASGSTAAVEITGGTFTLNIVDAASSYLIDATSSATYTISGGSFIGGIRAQGGTKYEITGGTFTNEYGNYNVYDGGDINISGGTFTGNYAQKFAIDNLAAGYELGANGTVAAKPVAEVNGVNYATLADAVAAAQNDATITLIGNVELAEVVTIPAGKKFTLDLNGKTITCGTDGYCIENTAGSTVTIKDTKGNGVVNGIIYNEGGSTMIIDGGTYNAIGSYALLNNAATMTINGGVIYGKDSYPIYSYNDGHKLTINNVTVNGECGCINAYYAGEVIINDGTFNFTGREGYTYHIVYVSTGTTMTINGGTFKKVGDVDVNGEGGGGICANGTGKLIITGGTFDGAISDIDNYSSNTTIEVSGGNFSDDSAKNYVAKGFELKKNADGTYGVVAVPVVAQIGEQGYATLEAAVEAANAVTDSQVTITLLQDVDYSGDDITANVVLDLNGKTVTSTGSYFFCLDAGKLTVKDSSDEKTGKLYGVTTGNAILVYGNSTLVVEDVEIFSNNNVITTFETNNTVVVNGGKLEANSATQNSAALYLAGSESTVTINAGTIIGNIPYNYGTLVVNGGSFTKDVSGYCAAGYATVLNEETGMYEIVAVTAENAAAKMGDRYFLTLNAALQAATVESTIVVLKDFEGNLESLKGTIVPAEGKTVTVNATNTGWYYLGSDFTIGEGVTFNMPDAMFFVHYTDEAVIKGKVIVNGLYIRYAGTRLTVEAPGALNVTGETFIIRDVEGDGAAGLYIVGDDNDETVELTAPVVYFYQGMINAKDANINVGTYWQTQETDAGYANAGAANLVLDNSVLNVTVPDHAAKATGNSTVTLKNGALLNTVNSFIGNAAITVDAAGITANTIVISGNVEGLTGEITLTGNDVATYAKTAEGLVVVIPKVAAIGETVYATLQAAIDAVKEGETITLVDDVNVTTPAYGQNALNHARAINFTLDLNGKTLSADTGNSVFRFNIANSGATSDVTLTIKNGKIVAGSNTWCAVMASGISSDVKAIMNLENLTIESSKANDMAVKSWSNATINAEKVTVNTTNAAGGFYAVGGEIVLDECIVNQKGLYTSPYMSMAFAVSSNGKMTINSGTYSAEPTAAAEGYNQGSTHGSWVGGVMNSGGTLIINGGTFSNDNFGDDALATYARGLIFADSNGKVTVNGGTFNALKSIFDFQNNSGKNPPVFTIYGGTYSADPSVVTSYGSVTIADGYSVFENNSVWNVAKVEAKIGDVYFATVENAMASNVDGVVEIFTDVTINDADAKDYTYTKDAKVNGTLTYTRTLPMVNTWMPLYVPFKISLSEEFLENYDIAYFNDVHGHDDNGDNVIDRTTIELIKISDPSKTIKANYPLVIRALNKDSLTLKITMDNATLYRSEENTVTVTSASSSYEIKGTYQKHETIADNQRVWGKDTNGNAAWGKLKEGSVLNPYRLILTITSRDDANLPFETIRMRVIGEDGEDGITYIEGVHQTVETGDEFIYDLQGRRVFEPTKGGIYIINGKKVYFK